MIVQDNVDHIVAGRRLTQVQIRVHEELGIGMMARAIHVEKIVLAVHGLAVMGQPQVQAEAEREHVVACRYYSRSVPGKDRRFTTLTWCVLRASYIPQTSGLGRFEQCGQTKRRRWPHHRGGAGFSDAPSESAGSSCAAERQSAAWQRSRLSVVSSLGFPRVAEQACGMAGPDMASAIMTDDRAVHPDRTASETTH